MTDDVFVMKNRPVRRLSFQGKIKWKAILAVKRFISNAKLACERFIKGKACIFFKIYSTEMR